MPHTGADADGTAEREQGGTVGELDGGVTRRLARRCWIASSALLAVSIFLLLVILLRTWGTVSAVLALVAMAAVIPGSVLAFRARRWSTVRGTALPLSAGRPAIVGPPQPLSPVRTGAPIRRKLGAGVVPIRADGPAQPGGGAVVVHARADGLALADGDRVDFFTIRANGVDPTGPAGDEPERQVNGQFVLLRISDGAAFLATTRLTESW